MARKKKEELEGTEELEEKQLELEDLPGVGPMTAEKLREAGYDTIMAIAVAPTQELRMLGLPLPMSRERKKRKM